MGFYEKLKFVNFEEDLMKLIEDSEGIKRGKLVLC